MVVKVHGSVRAACPQRVLACLLEKGVEFEVVHMDLDSGDQKRPHFLLLQPFGKVSVVEDDNFRLFESRATIRYMAAKYAEQGQSIGKKLGGARCCRSMGGSGSGSSQPRQLGFHSGFPASHLAQNGGAWGLGTGPKLYEERLSKSLYLAGDSFTLADLTHLPGMRYLMNEAGKGKLVAERKSVNAWWDDISNRPAWKKVMKLAH